MRSCEGGGDRGTGDSNVEGTRGTKAENRHLNL